jgi:hypothetical protein
MLKDRTHARPFFQHSKWEFIAFISVFLRFFISLCRQEREKVFFSSRRPACRKQVTADKLTAKGNNHSPKLLVTIKTKWNCPMFYNKTIGNERTTGILQEQA